MESKFKSSMEKELIRRKYSPRTAEAYIFCIDKFLKYFNKDPRSITKHEIRDYLEKLALRKKSGSTLNVYLSAIQFLMKDVLHRNIHLGIRFSRRPKSLPVVLTKDEIKRLFSEVSNKKHKLMLELMYSSGLRVSELLNLKVKDIEENNGWVRKGKGSKDRAFILANKIRYDLIRFIELQKPELDSFVFKGRKGKMSVRAVQEIIKKASKKAKIMKNVHPHTLRHSFATHLLEDGTDIKDIKDLLGHSNISTTSVYTKTSTKKLSKIKSPLDE